MEGCNLKQARCSNSKVRWRRELFFKC